MAKFEVGGIYKVGGIYDVGDDIEIEVLTRTDETITFKFTEPNWYEKDTEQIYRRNLTISFGNYEAIALGWHWSHPVICSNQKVN